MLNLLTGHGYLRTAPAPERQGAGRTPSPAWLIHPDADECSRKRGTDCPQGFGDGLAIVDKKSRAGRRVVGARGCHHAARSRVPTRAVMDVMGWSNASMASRYQRVPIEVITGIAGQVGGLLWDTDNRNGEDDPDEGAAGVLVAV